MLDHEADTLTFTVVTQNDGKPEVRTDTGSPSQERNYHGEKESLALNLQGKYQCLKFSLRGFFFSLPYRKSPGTHFLAEVAELPTEFVLAPQTHG